MYLKVILGVPIGVKNDAGVRGCQVDPQASCSRAEQEDKAVRVGLAEAVNGCLPQVSSHSTVNPLVQIPAWEAGKGCCLKIEHDTWKAWI